MARVEFSDLNLICFTHFLFSNAIVASLNHQLHLHYGEPESKLDPVDPEFGRNYLSSQTRSLVRHHRRIRPKAGGPDQNQELTAASTALTWLIRAVDLSALTTRLTRPSSSSTSRKPANKPVRKSRSSVWLSEVSGFLTAYLWDQAASTVQVIRGQTSPKPHSSDLHASNHSSRSENAASFFTPTSQLNPSSSSSPSISPSGKLTPNSPPIKQLKSQTGQALAEPPVSSTDIKNPLTDSSGSRTQ
ncbi:unnamed protein product [Protopolystoma xenopodis]|uniref:Uncharacterized protein n=1 Tax=Protopolystoma xenopodis TaxID=117903 RepID=A0A448WSQ7_9PLAT|nr:unnamed protein product [Protopolystoma xenopodis]